MPNPVTILLAGLTPQSVLKSNPAINPTELQAMLDKSLKPLEDRPNLKPTICWLDPEDKNLMENYEAMVKRGPGEGSVHFDGVLLGWGLRISPELTYALEDGINIVLKHSPSSKIMFSSGPTDHLVAIQRHFPEA